MSSTSDDASSRRELVLRRAAELTPRVGEDGDVELSAEDLLDVAAQAGIAPEAVLTALAEDLVEVTGRVGLVDRVVGPRRVWSSRVVDVDDAEANLQRWLRSGHGLRTWVRPDGVIVATPQRALAGRVTGAVRRAGGQGRLNLAQNVLAVAVEVDDGPGAVCAVVDAGNRRTAAVVVGSAVAGASVSLVAVVSLVAGPVGLVGLPVAAGLGTIVSRLRYRRTVGSVHEELARTLDSVARDEPPPGLLAAVGDRLRGW